MKQQDIITRVVYEIPEKTTQRDIAEAYKALFDDSQAAKIVATDLVQFTGTGSESFNPDVNVQNMGTGMKMVAQHIINQLNREIFIDEMVDLNGEED